MPECRLCGSPDLRSVLDLGATPPCERFLRPSQLDDPEPTYPLHLRICGDCLLLQIPALITPEDTFTDYAYYSSYSDSWVAHARRFVEDACARFDFDSSSLIVEVASNDGYLLQHAVERGIPCLGIEPSVNVGAAARAKGVPTLTAFLNETTALEICDTWGHADLVVANNVYAHVPDLLGFTRSLRTLLKDDGWLSIEVHHALSLVESGQFDTIYHEHFQYYTLLTAQRALATAGLDVVDAELLATHGGSIRLWARPTECDPVLSQRVEEILTLEQAAGLHSVGGYQGLRDHAERVKRDLLLLLINSAENGTRVAGYGAPGKANTLLNYCGIGPDLLPYTVDRNPYKHGTYTPGRRIPIYPVERIQEDRPDLVLVLPWNLRRELSSQLSYISQWGASMYFPMPAPLEGS